MWQMRELVNLQDLGGPTEEQFSTEQTKLSRALSTCSTRISTLLHSFNLTLKTVVNFKLKLLPSYPIVEAEQFP